MTATTYADFLASKVALAPAGGFEVGPEEVNPALFGFQARSVQWALAGGRRALFQSFGLGKSAQQLDAMRITGQRLGGRQLIVCPLGVRGEFARDAEHLLGMEPPRFVRRSAEVGGDGLYLTNYESVRDGRLDPRLFDAVSLDEAAVLRNFGSKTSQLFSTAFAHCPIRLVATATPSPNEYRELFEYAHFLGVMDRGQCMTRFTKRDSEKANNLTLLPTMEEEFWRWVASWALFVTSPALICECGCHQGAERCSCPCARYVLPGLDVDWIEVATPAGVYGSPDRDGQGRLVADAALGVTAAAAAKRDTLPERVSQLRRILESYGHVGPGAAGVHEGLPPGQPGADQRAEASPLPGRSGPAGTSSGPGEGVAAGESGTSPGAGSSASGEARRSDGSRAEGLVRGPQGASSGEHPQGQTPPLRPDAGDLRSDAGGAAGVVPDLLPADGEAGGGSRSRDGSSAGTPVRPVQRGAGNLRGRSDPLDESGRVSDQVVIWVELNDEQRAVERELDQLGLSYGSIFGTLAPEEVEHRLAQWRNRETYALICKPVMLGEGVNLQQCNKAIFLSASFKFHSFIQAVHRIHRFGQQRRCDVRFVHAEAERSVVVALRRKWAQHDQTGERMAEIITAHGLDRAALEDELRRSLGVERVELSGETWRLVNNDTVPETASMAEGSVGLIVTSIPFGTLYEYSAAIEDFGHSPDAEGFWAQMDYLSPHLLRILQPGRVFACHVKDRIVFGNTTGYGYSTVEPFHADAILHYRRHGFDFLGQITVVTDVVRENNQSYRLGWSEQCKDGSRMGVGRPEYVLLFRKPQTDRSQGRADVPVVKDKETYSRARWQVDAHAYWRDGGDRALTPEDFDGLPTGARSKLFAEWSRSAVYDYDLHVRIGERIDASGQLPATFMCLAPSSWHPDVWTEDQVLRFRTLNTEQARRRLDTHVCPMPFSIVDRLIARYSNEGEVVYDPFAGIGTVPRQAVLAGRTGWGTELCPAYFSDAVRYCAAAEAQVATPTLFDLLDLEAEHQTEDVPVGEAQ